MEGGAGVSVLVVKQLELLRCIRVRVTLVYYGTKEQLNAQMSGEYWFVFVIVVF